jgi:acyl dehydratase
MPLNQALKGKEYQEVSFPVVREQVLQFAEAIGEENPLFTDPKAARVAGYPEQLAPPTFVTKMQIMTSGQVVVDQELGLDYSRVVHGDQNFVHHRPIAAGDRLVVELHVDGINSRMGNDMISVRAEVGTVDGEAVTTARSTLVARGTDPSGTEQGEQA